MTRDRGFLEKAYRSASMWENWFRNTRMTTGRGLVEMFYGYDTGHDNSGRLEGMLFKGNAGDHTPTPEEKEKDVAPDNRRRHELQLLCDRGRPRGHGA